MENTEKNKIADALKAYCGRYDSRSQAAKSLKNISEATVSQMLSEKWDLISDKMWRNVAGQIGFSSKTWVGVETTNYKTLMDLFSDAQQYNNVFAVTGEAGSGKTYAANQYIANTRYAFYITCNEYWKRKQFLSELLIVIGRDPSGGSVTELMEEVVRHIKEMENPILIIDEADKITDQVLSFFITLYNRLENHCAIVLMATNHLEKRINRGLRLNLKGYNEIYSRIGRKFIELDTTSTEDIISICMQNGITEKQDIKEVIKESNYDLRRTKRKIHAIKRGSSKFI